MAQESKGSPPAATATVRGQEIILGYPVSDLMQMSVAEFTSCLKSYLKSPSWFALNREHRVREARTQFKPLFIGCLQYKRVDLAEFILRSSNQRNLLSLQDKINLLRSVMSECAQMLEMPSREHLQIVKMLHDDIEATAQQLRHDDGTDVAMWNWVPHNGFSNPETLYRLLLLGEAADHPDAPSSALTLMRQCYRVAHDDRIMLLQSVCARPEIDERLLIRAAEHYVDAQAVPSDRVIISKVCYLFQVAQRYQRYGVMRHVAEQYAGFLWTRASMTEIFPVMLSDKEQNRLERLFDDLSTIGKACLLQGIITNNRLDLLVILAHDRRNVFFNLLPHMDDFGGLKTLKDIQEALDRAGKWPEKNSAEILFLFMLGQHMRTRHSPCLTIAGQDCLSWAQEEKLTDLSEQLLWVGGAPVMNHDDRQIQAWLNMGGFEPPETKQVNTVVTHATLPPDIAGLVACHLMAPMTSVKQKHKIEGYYAQLEECLKKRLPAEGTEEHQVLQALLKELRTAPSLREANHIAKAYVRNVEFDQGVVRIMHQIIEETAHLTYGETSVRFDDDEEEPNQAENVGAKQGVLAPAP